MTTESLLATLNGARKDKAVSKEAMRWNAALADERGRHEVLVPDVREDEDRGH